MPINRKMMANMKKEYGKKSGKNIYYAMENKLKTENPKKAEKLYSKKK